MGSLFSGIGGFEVAAQWHGAEVVWQSEIEPWAVELLKQRFPKAKQLGDINDIKGSEIEPVDLITFGSPCVGLSVAGKRKGLADERSGLFREAIRIIKEMRKSTNGEYPKYILWENVPGALTSNKGCDFRAVLEEITETEIPMPKSGKWASGGMVRGGECDIAWRVLDAQYWGVPQRRKRIFLVGDYRSERSAEILFKPEGVSGYTSPSGEARKRIAATLKKCLSETGGADGVKTYDPYGGGDGTISPTIVGDHESRINWYTTLCVQPVYSADSDLLTVLNDQGGDSINVEKNCVSPTLRAETHGHPPNVCVPIYCLQGSMIGRADKNGPQGDGINENITFTLTVTDKHAVALPIYSIDRAAYNQGKNAQYDFSIRDDGLMQTLVAKGPNAVAVPNVACFQGQASPSAEISYSDKTVPTVQCTKQADVLHINENLTYIVRRLTPGECAQLQGFPPDWCEIQNESGKTMPDTAAYKGYGNAVATVCAEYPIAGIIEALQEEI